MLTLYTHSSKQIIFFPFYTKTLYASVLQLSLWLSHITYLSLSPTLSSFPLSLSPQTIKSQDTLFRPQSFVCPLRSAHFNFPCTISCLTPTLSLLYLYPYLCYYVSFYISMSLSLSVYISMYLTLCLYLYVSISMSLSLCIFLFESISMYLSLCIFLYESLSMY